jgi:hypothetical protein
MEAMMGRVAGRGSDPSPDALSRVGLKAFFRIADLWDLSVPEQMTLLGLDGRSTYDRWRKEGSPRLTRDTLERISYVLGIYKALQTLLPDVRVADSWVRQANTHPLYQGRAPLDRMLFGNVADLFAVRRHLDAERDGFS